MDGVPMLAALPMTLRWTAPPEGWAMTGSRLTITAAPATDWFVDPSGAAPMLNAPALVGTVAGDFLLSARVSAGFASKFDAGVLVLRADERTWAKLCLEFSPRRRAMVVSVVTRGISDDCNSAEVDGDASWLRIGRIGTAFAFHSSVDGRDWSLVRHFTFDAGPTVEAGFLAQSPTGGGCEASFDEIRFAARRLADIRSGE